MKETRFDERLKGIIFQARMRLRQRMKQAHSRGELEHYLKRIGLINDLAAEVGSLRLEALIDLAENLLEDKIRHARRKGFLKDYLGRVNMADILLNDKYTRRKNLRVVSSARNFIRSARERPEGQARHLSIVK